MSQRIKRRRLSSQRETNGFGQDLDTCVDDICRPASTVEKKNWNGFCEIESEPVGLLERFCILFQLLQAQF